MLEVGSLTKTYSTVPALENVSFTIAPGEVLGYLGPNGSGKSTTVKIERWRYAIAASSIALAWLPLWRQGKAKANVKRCAGTQF